MKGIILEIIVQNGLEALASLSMDQIPLYDENGSIKILNVVLRSADWAEKHMEKISSLFQEARNIQCDDSLPKDKSFLDEYINLEGLVFIIDFRNF